MSGTVDRSVQDRLETRLQLREDLSFGFQQYNGRRFVHLEVQETGDFFRVGFHEYVFISFFDGETTLAAAIQLASQQLGEHAFSEDHALRIYDWLLEQGLARVVGGEHAESALASRRERQAKANPWQPLLNPLSIRIPVVRHDRWLQPLQPATRWLFSWRATLTGMIYILLSSFLLWRDWDRFWEGTSGILAPANWLWLVLAWVLLKAAHELGHAVCCRRYGGEVREAGVVFVLLAPLAYVDVTSSWRFSSRWQRMHVALAGMYIEMLLAAIAVLWWSQCRDPALAQLLTNVIVMASFTTLVFNANPLMKFDGYYVLTDLLEFPNLQAESQRCLHGFCRWLFFGLQGDPSLAVGQPRRLALTYGTLAWLWRLGVTGSLLLAAATLFRGAGIVFACVAANGLILPAAWRTWKGLREVADESPLRLLRAGLVTTLGIAVGVALFTVVPTPWNETAPGVVDYQDDLVLRPSTSGFISQVAVRMGEEVQPGQLLVQLHNPELQVQVADLRARLQQTRLRLRQALQQRQTAIAQVERRNLQSLEEQLAEKEQQLQDLRLVATRRGRVVGQRIEELVGRYVQPGEELFRVASEQQKQVVAYVSHKHLAWLQDHVGENLPLRIGTRRLIRGRLADVQPRASRDTEHAGVLASAGGPLQVRQRVNEEGQTRNELLQPRFQAVVELDSRTSRDLYVGELGMIRLADRSTPLGWELYRRFANWVESSWEQATRYQG